MIRIITRKSQLALAQTTMVLQALEKRWPEQAFKIIPVSSEGDRHMGAIQGKSVFVNELEKHLLSDFADIAVHSLKDMSVHPRPGLSLEAVLERGEARDVLVSYDYPNMQSMPTGALIGTSSPRRAAQIKTHYPKLHVIPCRGNVITRLDKLQAGDFQGLILAGAGMERLQLQNQITQYLSTDSILPCPGQGIIAIQCRQDDLSIQSLVQAINHAPSYTCQHIERTLARTLDISCSTPIGIYARLVSEAQVELSFYLSLLEDHQNLYLKTTIDLQSSVSVAEQISTFHQELLKHNIDEVIGYYNQLKDRTS